MGQELKEELQRYEKAEEFKAQVENLLNLQNDLPADHMKKAANTVEQMDEKLYLLVAAFRYRTAVDAIDTIDTAFLWMMLAQESLGAMRAIALNRQQNSLRANKENIETKKNLEKYWNDHVDPKLSGPKAASLLKKQEPLSERKLTEYVNEFKKNKVRREKIAARQAAVENFFSLEWKTE